MRKILASVAAFAVVGTGAFFVAMSTVSSSDAQTSSVEPTIDTATFAIDNMTCATCPISVKKAMMRVDGVKTVDINYPTKTATVTFDPNLTTPEAIAAASTDVGYTATPSDG